VAVQQNKTYTFPKTERLHGKKITEELFSEGSYFYLYPYKVIYLYRADLENTQVLFTVPKRKFKTAVSRNRLKRQMKEAYRLNKQIIHDRNYLLAFIYTPDKKQNKDLIHRRVKKSLEKLISLEVSDF